jgi:hypothetical protein
MWKTLEMVDRTRPSQCSGNVFYPLPKTKLYDLAVESGELTPEGEEKVRRGESSFHQDSILEHPHKDLAEMLAKVTPVYVKAPQWAKPLLRKMVDRRMKRTAQALYVVLIPVTFSSIGKEAVRITLASTRAALRGGPTRRTVRHRASGGTRSDPAVRRSVPVQRGPLRGAAGGGSGAAGDHIRSAGVSSGMVPVTLRSKVGE